jgi:hypothetical protein
MVVLLLKLWASGLLLLFLATCPVWCGVESKFYDRLWATLGIWMITGIVGFGLFFLWVLF